MCGIAGSVRFDGGPVPAAEIEAMTARLVHRGPDARSHWTEGCVGLGHTRLSIIDLDGSQQPMESVDGQLHVAFNGEILNYRQLRADLDYPFRTSGDTEVLLALHERFGPSGVRRLRGQFAYALHDARTGELHLYRDRLGILPLYYAVDGRRLLFASEIKALLAVQPQPRVDVASLHDYLTYRSVHAPNTLFEGIRKLEPGHWLRVDRAGHVSVQPYWTVPNDPTISGMRPADAVERLDTTLSRAVDEALVADVPVGAYLSGGLDSSLIVALATRARGDQPVSTYSAGFGDPRYDELPWARRVSSLLGSVHHEVTVGPEDFTALLPTLTWYRDAPLSEPADLAVHRLATTARQDVKVVLSGEGSDELFAGYPKYRAARLVEAAELVPTALRRSLCDAMQRRIPARHGRLAQPLRAASAGSRAEGLQAWFAPFDRREREALLGGPPSRLRSHDPYELGRGDAVRRMLFADIHGWLPDNLLERGDRMSMSASLELRPPFLDVRVVELALAMSSDVKVRWGTTKWVLREVARRYLPAEVVDRRKVGFSVPLDAWFRGGLRDMARDRLTSRDAFVGQAFDRRTVCQLLDSHESGRRNEQIRLWTLLGLEVWHEVFFRSEVPASPEPAYTP